MDTAPVISTLPPELKSQDFNFLRSEGLSAIQAFAARSWTDHNLHDPGITLLEVISYAITEGGLKAGIDVKDLIASGSMLRAPEFFTAAQVLPTAPVTVTDYRKLLIDHPLVNNAWFFPLKPIPLGRYSALLEFTDDSLNSNNFVESVTVGTTTYTVDIALPHWDEEDVFPFREAVTLLSVAFDGPPGDEWNEIEDNTTFFARATIGYQPPVGPAATITIWIVVQITTEMEDPLTEAPPVLQEVLLLISDITANKPLDKLNKRIMAAHETMRIIRRFTLPYRNLCEDIGEFNAVRQQEVGVTAVIEIGAGVNIEDLVAEIFYSIDQLISPSLQFQTLDESMEQSGSADIVFNGPLTDGGFLDNNVLRAQQITSVIYTSDILRLIYQLRNTNNPNDVIEREDVNARRIISVRSLSLANFLDNRPISTKARDCLQLVKSQRHVSRLSLTKSRIIIFRNGIKVEYDFTRVLEIFEARKAADVQASASTAFDIPVPGGDVYPVGEYYPIQNDLPLVYGVGEAGLPDHVTATRRAQAKQLKGYLFMFEQMLAGLHAQLAQFNSFFSGDASIRQTLFQQPLYHIPGIAPLFAAYTGTTTTDWQTFQADANNPYAQLLRTGVESREQFLERRNAILDHLLASQGEGMSERAALVLRLAMAVPGGSSMLLPVLLEAQRQRRLNALEDLITDKSDYYFDVPALNLSKAQSYGNILWRSSQFVIVTPVPTGFAWQINNAAGAPLFRQMVIEPSMAAALKTADQAMKLATVGARYTIRVIGLNQRRLELRHNAASNPIAESITVYTTVANANTGITNTATAVREMWTAYALMPLEVRLYHMLGIDLRERRLLSHIESDYVDIFPDPVVNPNFRQMFRLRAQPGPGNVLLESIGSYPGTTLPEAIAAATDASHVMMDAGTDQRNYRIDNTGPNSFTITLNDLSGASLAAPPTIFTTLALAEAEVERIKTHLFRTFSAEGFYIIEHHLLYPPKPADTPLEIPGQEDPYSFQMTVIFPSGYERDFSDPTAEAQPARPSLYRNEEFRKYAEQQVRKHCPANILVRILWVDRSLAKPPLDPMDECIEAFEVLYFDWLRAYMTDEAGPAVIDGPRNALTEMINGLYNEYFTV